MEDAAKAPGSASWRSEPHLSARLEAALDELRLQIDPAPLLDELETQAESEGRAAALTAQLAALALSDALGSVPERARLAILLRAGHAPELVGATRRKLAERYAAAASSGSPERERRLLEQGLASFESAEPGGAAARWLAERVAGLPAAEPSEQSLLLTLENGGKDAEAALLTLGARWLESGRVAEKLAQLPRSAASLRSEAARELLERLFTEAGKLEAHAELLERRARLEPSALGRARTLEKLGNLRLEQEAKPEAILAFASSALAYEEAAELDDAERLLEQVLLLEPDQLSAAEQLVSVRARAGDFTGAASAFETALRLEADSRKAAELLLSIAEAAERAAAAQEFAELADDVCWRLGDERALTQRLLRTSARLLAGQTLHDEAAELYRRLIADEATPQDIDAYQALIDDSSASDWRSHHQRWLFEWQEHHSADRPTVLLSWARFEEQELGDPALAQSVLERAAQLAPDRPEIWENLTRLRLAAGDGAGGVSASHELRRLGREPDASLLELLLEYEPGARWAIDRVKLKLSAEARWTELFELYDRAIDAASSDDERASWLDEAALAARDVAQDSERAIAYWERYARLAPDDRRADLALERLYEQVGDKASLLRHLRARSRRPDVSERGALDQRLIALSLEVGALSDAQGALERATAVRPEQLVSLLERLFERSSELGGEGEARDAGHWAARRLREIYLERGDAEAARRLLRAELELDVDGAVRRELLAELSRVSETLLADPAGAFEAERELFSSTRAEESRERLERLARAQQRWSELCDALALAAEAEPELEAKRRLLARAARLASVDLEDENLATQLYGQLLQLEPRRARAVYEKLEAELVQPAAFEALCRHLEASGDFAELAEVLERAARPARDAQLLSRLARLQAEQLGDVAAAIETYLLGNDARSAGPLFLQQPSVFGDDGARAVELATRLHTAGLTEGALLVLRHQLAFYAERTPPSRKLVVLELARLLQESGDTDSARDELREAATQFPADAEVLRACAESAAAARDWETAEQFYRTQLLLVHGGGDASAGKAAVYVELAQIKVERGEPAAATELVESGFESALGSAPALAQLAERCLLHGMHAAAERATGELLQLARDLPTAARALACLTELGRAQGAPAELRAQATDLAERVADRYAELTDAGERSKLLAACVALLPLERAEPLLQGARDELTPPHAVRARLELARRLLESTEAEARRRALSELQALLAHPAAEAEAWPLLMRGLQAEGRIEDLKLALTARLEQSPSDAELLLRLAELTFAEGDVARAATMAHRAQRADPGSAEAVLLSAKLALADGRRAEALPSLLDYAQSKRRRRGPALAQVLRLAAELRLQQDELGEALPLLLEAHQLDESDTETALLLGLLAIDLDRLDTASAALRALLTEHEAKGRDGARSSSAAQGYFQLARIEQHHGKKINAKRLALRALEENPHLAPAQRLLSELGPH